MFLCCCCSFVVGFCRSCRCFSHSYCGVGCFVVRSSSSSLLLFVCLPLPFVRRVVVVLLVVATLSNTKSSVRVSWFVSSWRLQVFLSAFKVFDSDGNPCLVVSLTTGFSCSLVMLRSGTVYTRTPDHGQTKHEWQRARSYRCRLVRPNTCRANVLANPPGLALDPASNWRFAGLRAPCCL